jgi:arylsulfatase A-like enzyme
MYPFPAPPSFFSPSCRVLLGLTLCLCSALAAPNVLLIVADDLNDYIAPLGGHPQARTPHIDRLAASGVTFRQAHCNIPICNPSRASFVSGLYPHTSGCFGFEHWDLKPVLKNSRTMMAHFRHHGYHVLGTGKIMHNRDRQEWDEFGHPADYGPFGFDGENEIAHPDTPKPLRDDFGFIDGSLGPLRKLDGTGFSWRTGGWGAKRPLRYVSEDDRDPTGDELNAQWAIKRLRELAADPASKPFFMGVGFLRPHTPLIVPRKYFDRFPLDSIQLPDILADDVADTFKHTITSSEDDRSSDRGVKLYHSLVASYGGDRELALRTFIQAYLACVAAVDDLVGEILDTLDNSPLKDNTIVIFTSDHGWGMGEKDYLYKNSLWQESTRVPLLIRAPGVSQAGGDSDHPVSLIDLYPTLLELCELPADTVKNEKGRPLDGYSLVPLLRSPQAKTWDGPKAVLTALYKWAKHYDAGRQSYSLRTRDWRYIRYENGKEELYHTAQDPREWTNLALKGEYAERLQTFRQQLLARIPKPGAEPAEPSAEDWKNAYFKKHPGADSNRDGKLTWSELKAHKGGAGKPANSTTTRPGNQAQ